MSLLDKGKHLLADENQKAKEEEQEREAAYQWRQQKAGCELKKLIALLEDSQLTIVEHGNDLLFDVLRASDQVPLCRVRTRWEFPWRETADGDVIHCEPCLKTEVEYLKEYVSTSNIRYSADSNSGWHWFQDSEVARFLAQNVL